MSRLVGEKNEKACLGTPVPLSKGVNCIKGGKEARRGGNEILVRQTAQIILLFEIGEEILHFSGDVLGTAERTIILADAHRPKFSGLGVDILEEMTMDRSVVRDAKAPARQRLVRPLGRAHGFEGIKRGLITNVREVLKNARAWIAVWICYGVVHRPC
jgi:hypothetical protein